MRKKVGSDPVHQSQRQRDGKYKRKDETWRTTKGNNSNKSPRRRKWKGRNFKEMKSLDLKDVMTPDFRELSST